MQLYFLLSLGFSGEDSGPGKENEDWRAKPVSRSILVGPSVDVDISQLTNQANGIQVNKTNCNLQGYQTTNFMLNNLGANTKDKHSSSLIKVNEKGVNKLDYDQSDTSSACNKNSNSNHSSPLQPRRGKNLSD